MKTIKRRISEELRTNFIAGFLLVLPAAITLWVIWLFISKIVALSVKILPHDAATATKVFLAIIAVILGILLTLRTSFSRYGVLNPGILKD